MSKGNYNWPGVLGVPEPQRSVMDSRMQMVFGQGPAEAYISPPIARGVDLGERSTMDKWMQQQFNPMYEGYCSAPSASSVSQPNWLISNPNNPTSGSVKYLPLQ